MHARKNTLTLVGKELQWRPYVKQRCRLSRKKRQAREPDNLVALAWTSHDGTGGQTIKSEAQPGNNSKAQQAERDVLPPLYVGRGGWKHSLDWDILEGDLFASTTKEGQEGKSSPKTVQISAP